MDFWAAFVHEITGKWGWLLILSGISSLGFLGMTFSHFVKCLLTKNTVSLSKHFVILLPITNTLITIYDLILFILFYLNNQYGIAWSMLVPMAINGLISAYGTMILKLKHMKAAKKIGLTEEQYFINYLKPYAKIKDKKAK